MVHQENRTILWDRQAPDWYYHMSIKHTPHHYFDGIPFAGIQQIVGEALQHVSADDEILDVPSGANPYDYLPPHISDKQVTAVDFSPGMLRLNTSHIRLRADINEPLPVPDNTYSAVTSFLGMRYARNPGKTLQEFVRVLRPHGSLIIVDIDRSNLPTPVYGHDEQCVFSLENTAMFLAGLGIVCKQRGTLTSAYPSVVYYTGRKITQLAHCPDI